MWRKAYGSMYDGSLVGAGAMVFAVMNYVISKQEYHRASNEWRVRLNPVLLGAVLGEKPEDVKKAIEFLCLSDPDSTSKRHEGKRLMQCAPDSFEYHVVNGDIYQDRRDYDDRLAQMREAQARFRAKKRKRGKPMAGETDYCERARDEGVAAADAEFDKRQEAQERSAV